MFNISQITRNVQATAQRVSENRPQESRRPERRSSGRNLDRVQVSGLSGRVRATSGRTSRVNSITSGLQSFFGGVSQGIQDNANRANEGIQNFSDAAGRVIGTVASVPNRINAATTRAGFRLAEGHLRLFGQREQADRVAQTGNRVNRFQQRVADQGSEQVANFVSGVGDGIGSMVQDAGVMIANPGESARTIGRLAGAAAPLPVQAARSLATGRPLSEIQVENAAYLGQVGDAILDEYRQTRRDHGTAGALGRVAFDILGIVGTGGTSGAARAGGSAVARTVSRTTAEATTRGGLRVINGNFLGRVRDVAENTSSVIAPTIQANQDNER